MDEANFWEIVQLAHDQSGGDMEKKCDAIRNHISKLSTEEAEAFGHLFDAMMDQAYAWPLWGAAYIIGCGCGDDAFSDFRASLISRGRGAFERAISDPDSLAEEAFDEGAWFYEGYHYAVSEGVESAAGKRCPRAVPHPSSPSGQKRSEKNVTQLYPNLSAKFITQGDL
jgi:hypothetical protein